MGIALREAERAAAKGEVPVGAVLVRDGTILGRGGNLKESRHDPTAHAEIVVIRKATRKLRNWRLEGATLYVTLEPCPMCMGAVLEARAARVVFGCKDRSLSSFCPGELVITSGMREIECSGALRGFFRDLRRKPEGDQRSVVATAIFSEV
jgi:tRNA(adenine34) deaminase